MDELNDLIKQANQENSSERNESESAISNNKSGLDLRNLLSSEESNVPSHQTSSEIVS